MTDETKPLRVTVTDWVGMARLTGEHHIRFPSNRSLEEFLAAAPSFIAPASSDEGHLAEIMTEVERLRRMEKAFREWIALTDWVQEEFSAGGFIGSAGRHRATIMRNEIVQKREEGAKLREALRSFLDAKDQEDIAVAERNADRLLAAMSPVGPAIPPRCGKCHGTGFIDFAHLGLDPCDHEAPAVSPEGGA